MAAWIFWFDAFFLSLKAWLLEPNDWSMDLAFIWHNFKGVLTHFDIWLCRWHVLPESLWHLFWANTHLTFSLYAHSRHSTLHCWQSALHSRQSALWQCNCRYFIAIATLGNIIKVPYSTPFRIESDIHAHRPVILDPSRFHRLFTISWTNVLSDCV